MAGRKDRVAGPGKGSGCNCTALRKASRRISQLYDTALAPSGLKTTQRAILAQIGRSEPTRGRPKAEFYAYACISPEKVHMLVTAVKDRTRRGDQDGRQE